MAHGPSHKRFGAHWLFGENSWYQQSGVKEMLTGSDPKSKDNGSGWKLGTIDMKFGDKEMVFIYLIGAVVIYNTFVK